MPRRRTPPLGFLTICSSPSVAKQELESTALPYCYLDGSSKDRMKQVDLFQNDESIPVFLISLKAGGTGLNLTGQMSLFISTHGGIRPLKLRRRIGHTG